MAASRSWACKNLLEARDTQLARLVVMESLVIDCFSTLGSPVISSGRVPLHLEHGCFRPIRLVGQYGLVLV